MTKKEFVLQVVDQLLENPRKVLAGHGIQAAVLQTIVKRPDVMQKLASILYTLKTAKKGAVGLKKASNFQIKGYKTFPDMNMKAREDIETFIGGLANDDQIKFNNADNVITILMLPDSTGLVPGDEGDDVVQGIITGKSVLLPFDSAVRKEYKIPGGMYLVVMIGDSAVRPAEEKIALRNEKKNKRAAAKRTPAKIKMELKRKANKKLAKLADERAGLKQKAYNTKMQLAQANYLRDALGDDDIMYGIGKRNMQASNYQINKAGIMAGLTPEQKGVYSAAQFLLKRGDKTAAKSLLRKMGLHPSVATGSAPATGDAVVAARKSELRKKVRDLIKRNEQLMLDLSLAPAQKRLSIKSMISKNNSAIKALRARLGTYKNMTSQALNSKAAMLQQVNAAIEENIAAGNSISQALNTAIAELDATPQQKQMVKQQVMQQVASGMPMQYAVQQAVQDAYAQQALDTEEEVLDDTTLTGSYDINDLLASL